MVNPILALREQMQLTRIEFAHLLGVTYQSVFQAENGYVRHPYGILRALRGVIGDTEGLEQAWSAWREARTAQCRVPRGTGHPDTWARARPVPVDGE